MKTKTKAVKATTKASAKAPRTIRKRDIESKLRRLARDAQKHEDAATQIQKEMDELASKHCGFSVGDEVAYNGPDPSRFMTGIVVDVQFARGWMGYKDRGFPFPIVKVRPFLKGRGRKLTCMWNSIRHFTKPEYLKLVAPKGKVAPFTR